MFGIENVSTSSSKFIRPGIEDNVVIHRIEAVTPEGRAPYLNLTFYKAAYTPEDGITVRLYMTETSQEKSLVKLKHLATTDELVKGLIDADKASQTLKEFAENVDKVLSGHKLRVKFSGEEFTGRDGNPRQKATLGLPPFAESMSVNPTRLVWDKSNTNDLKPRPTPTSEAELTDTTEGSNLPF